MRILMLGWEFPPFISGGLGTACYGLTRALSQAGVEVLFVLPRSVPAEYAGHVRLLSPRSPGAEYPTDAATPVESADYEVSEFQHVRFRTVPAQITSPYLTPAPGKTRRDIVERSLRESARHLSDEQIEQAIAAALGSPAGTGRDYGMDILAEAERYASLVVQLTRGERFDVVHAHDWMTFPAGLALSRIANRPLVVHVHSTEFDRAGENAHRDIYDIERRGMHGADRVIAVSYLTRRMCIHRYGIDPDKVEVVYNGIEHRNSEPAGMAKIRGGDKVVLFLGRITMQKGPEYFIAAARKVLEKVKNAKFVVAGSGDMAGDMIQMAVESGIASRVLFTGFLRGRDVDRVFRMADVYVMPSVSEPFGIAPLEAIQNDVPVIISKNSGVAEVVKHALKVDFWDVDDIAEKIIAVLTREPLAATLREQADIEVRKLTWDGAAHRCVEIYKSTRAASPASRT